VPIPAPPAGTGSTDPPPFGPAPDDPLVAPDGVTASQFTLRWFASLPEFVRVADAAQDWQLLRYMSLIGDQADVLEQLYERIDFTPLDEDGDATPSALIDPDTADAAWLPWLAQTVGARVDGLTTAAARVAVDAAAGGWRAGSKGAIAAAARTVLTGTKSAKVYDHSDGVLAIGAGGDWDVLILTNITESPSSAEVIAAVDAAGARPAGVNLHHLAYTATWAQLAAAYPHWSERNGLTWRQIHTTGM